MPYKEKYDNQEEAQNKGPVSVTPIVYALDETLEVNYLNNRIDELKQSRQDVEGVNIDEIWAAADKAYQPRVARKDAQRVLVQGSDWSESETSQYVNLEDDHWQSDNIQPTEYIKIQGVLSVIVDNIPEADFESFSERYFNAAMIQRELYKTSWDIMSSVKQLRYFTFNCAKYGFAISHTFPVRKGWNVRLYNQAEGTYYETFHVERDGVFRENLDPRYCWIDDMANPSDPLSARDWYREFKLPREEAESRYGHLKYWNHVPAGDSEPEVQSGSTADSTPKKVFEKDTVTVGVYENKVRDQLAVKINDVWVIIRHPLPGKHKRLSCWYAPWSIRSANTIYGIGIPEAMREDKNLKDKVRNMSIDALVAAIYPFGFYSGANEVSGTGDIKYRPGLFNRVTSPKDIGWLKAPGPGQEVERFLESLDKDLDEESAYTRALAGEQIGKTAFEVKNSRDAGLQRLQLPLKEIAEALSLDAVLTAHLHEQILSIPDVIELVDQDLIERYRKEVEVILADGTTGPDPELFQEVPSEESDTETKTYAFLYPEVQLGLQVLPDGTLRETDEKQFFRIKPSGIKWEGIVKIKPASIVSRNEQVEKQQTLELFDVVVPLLTEIPPEMVPRIAPAVRQVFKSYGEDPFKWLPADFFSQASLQPEAQPGAAPEEESLLVGANGLPVAPQPAPSEEEGEKVGSKPNAGGLPTVSGRGRERLAIRREQSKAQIENRVKT